MPWKNVDSYTVGYNIGTKQFIFYYQLHGESVIHSINPSAQDFIGLTTMFKNETTISFNTDGNYFASGPEPVGH